jgi:hypothetical protein
MNFQIVWIHSSRLLYQQGLTGRQKNAPPHESKTQTTKTEYMLYVSEILSSKDAFSACTTRCWGTAWPSLKNSLPKRKTHVSTHVPDWRHVKGVQQTNTSLTHPNRETRYRSLTLPSWETNTNWRSQRALPLGTTPPTVLIFVRLYSFLHTPPRWS